MSHELNLAITLPAQPLLLAAPVLVIVLLLLIIKVRGQRRSKKGNVTGLAMASIELGIDLDPKGSERGPVAQGKVNNNVVSIAPMSRQGRKNKAETQYEVKYEAPEAPKFLLTKRVDTTVPTLDTGNPKFDAVVAVVTDQPSLFANYVTASRRASILRLMSNWPAVQITNRETHFTTVGSEDDSDKIVDAVCHLVAAAETFDRPSPRPQTVIPATLTPEMIAEATREVDAPPAAQNDAPAAQTASTFADNTHDAAVPETDAEFEAISIDPDAGLDDLVAAAHAIYGAGPETAHALEPDDDAIVAPTPTEALVAPATAADHVIQGDTESDILTEVRLDEATVLKDLFNSGLDQTGTSTRFQQVYQGREVSWTGEVLRLGPTDRGRQRIAAFVGSADGEDPTSGRVVALTAVSPEPVLSPGDVVSFRGTLVNLDVSQRLFHVV